MKGYQVILIQLFGILLYITASNLNWNESFQNILAALILAVSYNYITNEVCRLYKLHQEVKREIDSAADNEREDNYDTEIQ